MKKLLTSAALAALMATGVQAATVTIDGADYTVDCDAGTLVGSDDRVYEYGVAAIVYDNCSSTPAVTPITAGPVTTGFVADPEARIVGPFEPYIQGAIDHIEDFGFAETLWLSAQDAHDNDYLYGEDLFFAAVAYLEEIGHHLAVNVPVRGLQIERVQYQEEEATNPDSIHYLNLHGGFENGENNSGRMRRLEAEVATGTIERVNVILRVLNQELATGLDQGRSRVIALANARLTRGPVNPINSRELTQSEIDALYPGN